MIFASPLFLFLFFPVVLLSYLWAPVRWRNTVLLLASAVFYISGAGWYALLLLALIMFTVVIAPYTIDRRPVLWVAVVVNLIPLLIYKYAGFIGQFFSNVSGATTYHPQSVLLPLGISFYTFHAISYLVDVAHQRVEPDRRGWSYALYILLFPHLIAGPIVRFKEIRSQFADSYRAVNANNLSSGLQTFCIGFSKKILIGDHCAILANQVFANPGNYGSVGVWVGVLAYTLQIYFDFSGYSDMAIGLARMFGYRFPRNFRRPYISQSITEFWRRWHMSLSRWFRDYVYIPLGGNRHGTWRTYFNLWAIFFLCGLWHGANYTFVVWGIGHGVFMVLERTKLWRPRGWWGQFSTLMIVMWLWVPFRAPDIASTLALWQALVGWGMPVFGVTTTLLFEPKNIFILAVGLMITIMPQRWYQSLIHVGIRRPSLQAVSIMGVFVLAIITLIDSGFTPFIYAKF
jgi:alginate O-acetyltransferase complex protein AlgI